MEFVFALCVRHTQTQNTSIAGLTIPFYSQKRRMLLMNLLLLMLVFTACKVTETLSAPRECFKWWETRTSAYHLTNVCHVPLSACPTCLLQTRNTHCLIIYSYHTVVKTLVHDVYFNKQLNKFRKTIDCAFGILYSKSLCRNNWRKQVAKIVKAACVLQNVIIEKGWVEGHLKDIALYPAEMFLFCLQNIQAEIFRQPRWSEMFSECLSAPIKLFVCTLRYKNTFKVCSTDCSYE